MSAPNGRPPKFKTVKDMQTAIDDYFDECDNRIKEIHTKEGDGFAITVPEPYTMAGLAYALDMSRQALIDYTHKDGFLDAIKKARARVERDVERRLMEGQNQTGAIFNLKNNFGWRDKTEIDHTTKGDKINAPAERTVVDDFVEKLKDGTADEAKPH